MRSSETANNQSETQIGRMLEAVGRGLELEIKPPESCPSEDELNAYIELLLKPADLSTLAEHKVGEHIGNCNECFRFVNYLHMATLLAQQQERTTFIVILRLAQRIEECFLEWKTAAGEVVRRQLQTPLPGPLPRLRSPVLGEALHLLPAQGAPAPGHGVRTRVKLETEEWKVTITLDIKRDGCDVTLLLRDTASQTLPSGTIVRLLDRDGNVVAERETIRGIVNWTGLHTQEHRIEIGKSPYKNECLSQ